MKHVILKILIQEFLTNLRDFLIKTSYNAYWHIVLGKSHVVGQTVSQLFKIQIPY